MVKKAVPTKLTVQQLEDGSHAPFVIFDGIPTFGCSRGLFNFTLTANRYLPDGTDIDLKPVVTAHLRCTRDVAILLRDTIDKALLLGATTAGPAN